MNHPFARVCVREWLIRMRSLQHLANALVFFVMIPVFFVLALPADPVRLKLDAPAFFWAAVIFVLILEGERLFTRDFEDGVLEQWMVCGYPLAVLILARLLVQWVTILIPMLVLVPVQALLFGLNGQETMILLLSLVCATPGLVFLCALGAALSVGTRQGGMLSAITILPLAIPVMVFGSAAVTGCMQGQPVAGELALLAAFSVLTVTLLPFAIGMALRIRVAG